MENFLVGDRGLVSEHKPMSIIRIYKTGTAMRHAILWVQIQLDGGQASGKGEETAKTHQNRPTLA